MHAGGRDILALFRERHLFTPGQTIRLRPRREAAHVFDSATGNGSEGMAAVCRRSTLSNKDNPGGHHAQRSISASQCGCSLCLKSMGHGDYIVLSDLNSRLNRWRSRRSMGACWDGEHHLRPGGRSDPVADAARHLHRHAAQRMEVVGDPNEIPVVQQEVQAAIDKAEGKHWPLVGVERYAFYDLAKKAYAVVQTGERRFYGCFILTKGVIPPDAA